MANVRITTNTTGTQPVIKIGMAGSNLANALLTITIPFVQDVTVTNSTGVYSYSTFTDVDMRKLSTPADNEISTNVVLDEQTWFGNSGAAANSALFYGLSYLSINKNDLDFQINYNGPNVGAYITTGGGFITSLAPTTSPDAPVWISPLSIAVDGGLLNGVQA